MAALAALFLVVSGARLWIIDSIGSLVPYSDQWAVEGWTLFKPFLLGHLDWSNFFAAHNEHRVLFTRLLAFGLFRANGMWDPRLEMVVNALIVAGTATLIASLALREIGRAWWRLVILMAAVVWSLPYGAQNTTWGFQSCFYFLLLFSFLALWGLSHGAPFTARWWIGLASAALACLDLASGLLAGLAVAAMRSLAIALDRRQWRTHWLTLLAGLACAAMAILLVHQAPGMIMLRAQGPGFFLEYLMKCLSWPSNRHYAFLLFQAPFAAVAWGLVREKGSGPGRCFILALGIWWALQAGALAYGRAGNGIGILSRYTDILALGFLGSFLALLVEWPPVRFWIRCCWPTPDSTSERSETFLLQANFWLRFAWAVLAIGGLVHCTDYDRRKTLPQMRRSKIEQVRRCRAYVESGDPAVFRNLSDPLDIPLWKPDMLAKYLDDPQVRSTLLFVPGQEDKGGWPSRISNRLLRNSRALFALGMVGLFAALWPPAEARGEDKWPPQA